MKLLSATILGFLAFYLVQDHTDWPTWAAVLIAVVAGLGLFDGQD